MSKINIVYFYLLFKITNDWSQLQNGQDLKTCTKMIMTAYVVIFTLNSDNWGDFIDFEQILLLSI